MTLPASPEVRAIFRDFVDRKKAEHGDNWKEIEAGRSNISHFNETTGGT